MDKSGGWLSSFVKANFYGVCPHHGLKATTLFCKDCMGLSFCDECSKAETHSNHNLIRVCKASHVAAVNIEFLKDLDISTIHTYIINRKSIVFVRRRGYPRSDNRFFHGNHNNKCCEICGFVLESSMPNSQSRFCSVQCMVTKEINRINNNAESQTLNLMEPQQTNCKVVDGDHSSKRKRSRKGVPIRSPFF